MEQELCPSCAYSFDGEKNHTNPHCLQCVQHDHYDHGYQRIYTTDPDGFVVSRRIIYNKGTAKCNA